MLEQFSLRGIYEIRPNLFPSLYTLILRDISTGYDGTERLENAPAIFPHIQHLVCSIYKNILSLLTPGYRPTLTFMPRLRTIALLSPYTTIPWLAVRDLLVARKPATGQPIRKLFVGVNQLAEVSVVLPRAEGIVQVEEWKSELAQGRPAWATEYS